MKPSTLPWVSTIALAAMSAAVGSHWWTVNQLVAAVDSGLPILQQAPTPTQTPAPLPVEKPAAIPAPPEQLAMKSVSSQPDALQKDFYESLIRRIENLQDQNRDLIDQMAETNRDIMKLEFRVDTHSEQFRPMPVSEDRIETTFDADPGVLPPRAEPVNLPSYE